MLYGSGIQVLYVLLLFFQVIARIFYVVNRSWSGRLGVSELRRSNFLSTLRLLDEEDDINAITDFFSYEHFYVIYCKFWELDKDHDLFIDREDLSRHNDHGKQQTVGFFSENPSLKTTVGLRSGHPFLLAYYNQRSACFITKQVKLRLTMTSRRKMVE